MDLRKSDPCEAPAGARGGIRPRQVLPRALLHPAGGGFHYRTISNSNKTQQAWAEAAAGRAVLLRPAAAAVPKDPSARLARLTGYSAYRQRGPHDARNARADTS